MVQYNNEKLYFVSEVSNITGIPTDTIKRWLRNGDYKYVQSVGNGWRRVPESEVKRMIALKRGKSVKRVVGCKWSMPDKFEQLEEKVYCDECTHVRNSTECRTTTDQLGVSLIREK